MASIQFSSLWLLETKETSHNVYVMTSSEIKSKSAI
jgi:hypothetical protein